MDTACDAPSNNLSVELWRSLGTVSRIYIRGYKEAMPRSVSCIQAIAGCGLVGDRHASKQSPRQVLVVGEFAYDRWALPEAALRENLRFDFSTESLRSGDLVRIGSDVILWITFTCEPCRLLERRCPGTQKAIGAHRGLLARVVRGGSIQQGDTVQVTKSSITVISDDWRLRVLHVARMVPEGCRINFRQLAELAGVPTAYCRAFPRVLSSLPEFVSSRVGSRSDAHLCAARPWTGAEIFAVEDHLPF